MITPVFVLDLLANESFHGVLVGCILRGQKDESRAWDPGLLVVEMYDYRTLGYQGGA